MSRKLRMAKPKNTRIYSENRGAIQLCAEEERMRTGD
jgi:hypothetical protein